ncbi:MAG TPA: LytS/YhcK type 5TM receptor domain-containing protein [Desulfobacteria bacterium]|nr:LytS/YhcK type 5TM receptor domain-containing protein [Desulfobacteria bacterium]
MVAGINWRTRYGRGGRADWWCASLFLWGFTALPCALATVLVGLFGGLIYRLRKGTFVSVAGAVAFAALMEVFHMVLVLLLARPYSQAVLVVREVAMPMIVANALGIMIFAFK